MPTQSPLALYPHQLWEVKNFPLSRARGLLWDMRLGKSPTTLRRYGNAWMLGCIDAILIVAPNGPHVDWINDHVPTWCDVPWRALAWRADLASKSAPRRRREYLFKVESFLRHDPSTLPILAVNKATLLYTQEQKATSRRLAKPEKKHLGRHLLEAFLKAHPRVAIVWDECHHFRNPTGTLSKFAHALARQATANTILSGTVYGNSAMHLWSQYELLGASALGYDWWGYRSRFGRWKKMTRNRGTPREQSFPMYLGPQNQDELIARQAPWVSVLRSQDVHGMPAVVRHRRTVAMTPKQANAYRTLERDCLLELDTGDLTTAVQATTLLTRLLQLLSGWVKEDDTDRIIEIVPFDKCPRIAGLLETIAKRPTMPVVVWSRFKHDITRIGKALDCVGRPWMPYHGDIPHRKRWGDYERFKAGDCDPSTVFVVTPDTGAEGLKLSRARLQVWYSQTDNLVHRNQADARGSLLGGEDTDIVDLLTVGGVDTGRLALLERKGREAEVLTRGGLRDVILHGDAWHGRALA